MSSGLKLARIFQTAADSGTDAPRSHRTNRLVPAAVLLIGIVLSVIASQSAREETSHTAELRFDTTATNATVQFERRIAAYFEVLAGVRALFNTVDDVSREDFRRYSQDLALKRDFPGFQVLNYAPYVAAGSKEAFEDAVRHDPSLPPGVRFGIFPPGERDGYYPFTLIEPLAENLRYLGKDIGAGHTGARATLELARDTGKVSANVVRPQGTNGKLGLAVRLPIYRVGMPVDTVEQRRAAYRGSVGAGIWMTEMLAELPGVPAGVRLRLFDGGLEPTTQEPGAVAVVQPDKLLFDTGYAGAGPRSGEREPDAAGGLRRLQSFTHPEHQRLRLDIVRLLADGFLKCIRPLADAARRPQPAGFLNIGRHDIHHGRGVSLRRGICPGNRF